MKSFETFADPIKALKSAALWIEATAEMAGDYTAGRQEYLEILNATIAKFENPQQQENDK